MKVVGDLVMQDIGLSAKVLQLANAAGFGVGRSVSSAGEAVTMLGIDLLRTLVLADHVFRSTVTLDWRAERMWDHCVHVAGLARAIARHEGLRLLSTAASTTRPTNARKTRFSIQYVTRHHRSVCVRA